MRAVLSLTLAVTMTALTARADDAQADRHLTNGDKLFHDRNYGGASAEYEACYRERPAASTLLKLAEARRAMGDLARAEDALRVAVERHAAGLSASEQQAARAEMASLAPQVAFVSVRVDPGSAVLTVDGEQGLGREGGVFALNPGTHQIAATAPGYAPQTQTLSTVAGESGRTVALALLPAGGGIAAPPRDEAKPKRHSSAMMITGIALTGVGIAAAVTGVIIMAAANNGQLGACGATTCKPAQQRAGGAIVAIGGGVAVTVGVPLWVFGSRDEPPPGAQAGLNLRTSF